MLLSPFYGCANREVSGSPAFGKPGCPSGNERSHLCKAIQLLKGAASLGKLEHSALRSKPLPFGAPTGWALGSETPKIFPSVRELCIILTFDWIKRRVMWEATE